MVGSATLGASRRQPSPDTDQGPRPKLRRMAFLILIGVVLLLGAGLAVAIKTAFAARQELEDLEAEIAETRGMGLEPDSTSDLWTPSDLEVLRDDDEVDRSDPFLTLTRANAAVSSTDDSEVDWDDQFSTLTRADSPTTWHAAPESRPLDPEPYNFEPEPHPSDPGPTWHAAARPTLAEPDPHPSDPGPTWHAAARPTLAEPDPHPSDPGPTWHAAARRTLAEPDPHPSNPGPTWQAAPRSNGSVEANVSEPTSSAALAPLGDLNPVAWRTSADAPIIVLVVGAGFLGTGMTAGVTTAARLRQAWSRINDSFGQTGVITLDPDAEPSPSPPSTPADDSRDTGQPRAEEPAPEPATEPKPIVWRAPAGARRR
jgi:hypothetical protein